MDANCIWPVAQTTDTMMVLSDTRGDHPYKVPNQNFK